jgi:hypothetical protein
MRIKSFLSNFWGKYKIPCSVFLLGNIIIALVMFLGTDLALYIHYYHLPAYLYALVRWDSGWYKAIVLHGYTDIHKATVQSSIVFFPLYPLLVKIGIFVFHKFAYSSVIVNEVCLFFALIFFYKLGKKLQFGDDIMQKTLLLFAFLPFSFFLFLPYTESLFLAFIFLTFLLLEEKHYFWGAVVVGIATAIRVPALILVVVYASYLLFPYTGDIKKLLLQKQWLYLPLCISGIFLYILYLKFHFHDPFGFLTDEAAWGHQAISLRNVFYPISFLLTGWHHVRYQANMNAASIFALYYDTIEYVNVLFLFFPVIAFYWIYKHLPKPYIIFCVLYLCGILLSADPHAYSVGRYALPLFPLYVALAVFAQKRNIFTYMLLIFFSLFMIFSVFYINFYGWIA